MREKQVNPKLRAETVRLLLKAVRYAEDYGRGKSFNRDVKNDLNVLEHRMNGWLAALEG